MPKKTIESVDVAGKRVLIRVDFNVPIENGKITDDRRIRMALPTIKSVLNRAGKAILISHLGRPEGNGYEPSESLEPVAKRLSELLGKPVAFPSRDCTDGGAAQAVAQMRSGEVVLLENLRFHKGEKKGDPAFAAQLAAYADMYVNDAFGTCHRPDASMVALPQALKGKPRVVGLLVERELRYLSDALKKPASPFVLVLGGAKVSDKIKLIDTMIPKADSILIGGAMAYTFLAALGRSVGKSSVETDSLPAAQTIIDHAARAKCELHLPDDHVCSTVFAAHGGEHRVFDEEIEKGFIGLDIGPRTQTQYAGIILRAKTIVWNGPMGVFEWKSFAVGTEIVARAMADATARGATTIVGGGDSAAAAELFGVADKVSHVSTGGGASLEMLAGHPFESVELLDNA